VLCDDDDLKKVKHFERFLKISDQNYNHYPQIITNPTPHIKITSLFFYFTTTVKATFSFSHNV
jgi:hypothetical protein